MVLPRHKNDLRACEGEHSFVLVDGQFRDGPIKQVKKGDYRNQSLYGGIEIAVDSDQADQGALSKQMHRLLPDWLASFVAGF